MQLNEHKKAERPTQTEAPSILVPAFSVPPPPAQMQTAVAAAPASCVTGGALDTSEEGSAHDGRGGMGQPRGTASTYMLEGMEEMGHEEYRKALQESVMERQRQRRGRRIGNVCWKWWDLVVATTLFVTTFGIMYTSDAPLVPRRCWRMAQLRSHDQ
jgi:hypothetical protein